MNLYLRHDDRLSRELLVFMQATRKDDGWYILKTGTAVKVAVISLTPERIRNLGLRGFNDTSKFRIVDRNVFNQAGFKTDLEGDWVLVLNRTEAAWLRGSASTIKGELISRCREK